MLNFFFFYIAPDLSAYKYAGCCILVQSDCIKNNYGCLIESTSAFVNFKVNILQTRAALYAKCLHVSTKKRKKKRCLVVDVIANETNF